MYRRIALRGTFLTAVIALVSAAALGQSGNAAVPKASENWGTTGTSVYTIPSFAFQPIDGAAVYGGDIGTGRYIVSGGQYWAAPVSLPPGAIVNQMEINGCDTSDAADLGADLVFCTDGSPCVSTFPVEISGTPGCGLFASSGSIGIDNGQWTYYVRVWTPDGSDTRFTSVRLLYQLRVSPAPSTPTFNDVPTNNPFYQYIEALVASGVTAGCGGGNYCPDSPVTRGQLAAILAKALGLYWPDTILPPGHP